MVIILEILTITVGCKEHLFLQLKLHYKIEDECHGRIALLTNRPLFLIIYPGPLQLLLELVETVKKQGRRL